MVAPLFDWVGYGAMRPFFNELFTGIFWLVEILLMGLLWHKKFSRHIFSNPGTKGVELPYRRMAVILLVVVACILAISAQIRFNVKPFYDLGEKFNGYELTNHLGIFLRNIIKCMWLVIMIKAMQNFVEQCAPEKKILSKIPAAGVILMLTVGVYDLVISANNLPLTYFFLYLVYGWLYLLTDRNMIKTYLLVMFIFLF